MAPGYNTSGCAIVKCATQFIAVVIWYVMLLLHKLYPVLCTMTLTLDYDCHGHNYFLMTD